ncbi:MAG TPA: hypothetical protein VIM69_03745 [Opitutaceae bacterium]
MLSVDLDSPTWESCMRAGDFAAAWKISDDVLKTRREAVCSHWPRHEQFIWRGDTLAGKRVLVRCYHGLGDSVQFIRYLPMLQSDAAEVAVWIQPELISLAEASFPSTRFVPLHDGTPEVSYDVDVEIMELPHIFRTTLDTLPATVPYLHATPQMKVRAKRGLQVGLIWESGNWNPARSVPLNTLQRLLNRFPKITWHAFQRGPALALWSPEFGPNSGSDRVEEAAAALAALDLIISVDSFTAHLAGALGQPVWTLLPEPADWRWMQGRETTPWYPTMKLFRQPRAGDWDSVMDSVSAEIHIWLANHSLESGDLLVRQPA